MGAVGFRCLLISKVLMPLVSVGNLLSHGLFVKQPTVKPLLSRRLGIRGCP